MRAGHRRAHGWLSVLLAAAVGGVLYGAYAVKQDRDAAPAPVLLERPAPAGQSGTGG